VERVMRREERRRVENCILGDGMKVDEEVIYMFECGVWENLHG
jgi:hypothetical protein